MIWNKIILQNVIYYALDLYQLGVMNQMSINNNFAMNDIIDIFIKTCKIENY